jgi:hypothetical protein
MTSSAAATLQAGAVPPPSRSPGSPAAVTRSSSQSGASAIGSSLSQRYAPLPGRSDGGAITIPPSPLTSTPSASVDVEQLMWTSPPGCL